MRAIVPELPSPYPLASFLPDVYLEDPAAEAAGAGTGVAPFPPGAYVLAIGGGDRPVGEAERGLIGEWTLSLSAGSAADEAPAAALQLALARDGKSVATGTARIAADTLSVTSSNCASAEGRYSWRFA